MDLNAIVKRTQWLLKDTKASWATDAFLLEGLNQVYEEAFLELEDINYPFDIVVSEITALAANTADLSAKQASGQTLEFMVEPLAMEWRLAGGVATDYVPVEKVDKLPDVPTGGQQSVDAWEWRGQVIYITPPSVSVDLRIRYKKLFAELTGTDGTLAINSIRPFLGYRAAALCAGIRENYNLAKFFDGRGQHVLDLIESNFVKDSQQQVRRLGSPARQRRQSTGRIYPNLRSS